MQLGRLNINHLHRRPWRQGFRISWHLKPRPGDNPWHQRFRFFEWYLQW